MSFMLMSMTQCLFIYLFFTTPTYYRTATTPQRDTWHVWSANPSSPAPQVGCISSLDFHHDILFGIYLQKEKWGEHLVYSDHQL